MSCTVGMVFSSVPTVLDNAFESLVEERESSAPTKQSAVQAEAHVSDVTDVKASDWFYPYL